LGMERGESAHEEADKEDCEVPTGID